ncbi:uncharacterized protein B4U79_12350 [Dinothrombium tinctorium]|uniref:Uncharacterized protein n=1 Tax=Dinothrombium tinctorium TaxID=1965070 RepID=A0A3S3S8J7_9ACAR|nr:uncharacterized protein B4U79_02931 [Dinothrombium tinctorium]RWS10660.1 uncharacterized protein B4U79_12350 [Dinothrombium tinctorium]
MRPPKLPGAEKFKFADKTKTSGDDTSSTSSSGSSSQDSCSSPATTMFIRGHLTRNTCPPVTSSAGGFNANHATSNVLHSFDCYRSDSRRHAFLPITSPMTSRVLSSTDLPLKSFYITESHHNHHSGLSSSAHDLREATTTKTDVDSGVDLDSSIESKLNDNLYAKNNETITIGIPQLV